MAERCTCGAQPPDDARFCHKCGRPLYDYVPADVEESPPPLPVAPPPQPAAPQVSFRNGMAVRIGLMTALLMILLNAFPLPPILTFVRLLALSFGGGWFAVWSWTRRTRQQVSMQDGARLGWIAGVFTFLFFAGLMTVLLVAAMTPGAIDEIRRQAPNDASAKAFIDFLQNPGAGQLLAVLIGLFIFFTALPTLGGALSARLLNREVR